MSALSISSVPEFQTNLTAQGNSYGIAETKYFTLCLSQLLPLHPLTPPAWTSKLTRHFLNSIIHTKLIFQR